MHPFERPCTGRLSKAGLHWWVISKRVINAECQYCGMLLYGTDMLNLMNSALERMTCEHIGRG